MLSGDLNGLDFPDLNGGLPLARDQGPGAPGAAIRRGRFEALRAGDALGVKRILNEWSANPANGVEMDWVLTLPGQYTMLNLPRYAAALAPRRGSDPQRRGSARGQPPLPARIDAPADVHNGKGGGRVRLSGYAGRTDVYGLQPRGV